MPKPMTDYLWDALKALYLATVDPDLTFMPGTGEDAALGAYNATWEAIVKLQGSALATSRWIQWMRTLPPEQRSSCTPDGN